MLINSGDKTHRPFAVDPAQFRAQATGTGNTLTRSKLTGAARAQQTVDQTNAACLAAVPVSEGLPAKTPELGFFTVSRAYLRQR